MSRAPIESRGLRLAIAAAGSQSKLSLLIGRRQSTISDWVRDGKPLPAEYVLTLERALGISRSTLRPDLYPLDGQPSSLPAGRTLAGRPPVADCDRGAKSQLAEPLP